MILYDVFDLSSAEMPRAPSQTVSRARISPSCRRDIVRYCMLLYVRVAKFIQVMRVESDSCPAGGHRPSAGSVCSGNFGSRGCSIKREGQRT